MEDNTIEMIQVSETTEINSNTKNGLIEQIFIFPTPVDINHLRGCDIIAMTDVMYGEEIVVKKGEKIRYYSSLPMIDEEKFQGSLFDGKTDFAVTVGPKYFAVLDVRSPSTFGKDYQTELLKGFSAAVFINPNTSSPNFERKF